MADEDTQVDVDVDGSPAAVAYQQPTTTAIAQSYSKKILDRQLSSANQSGEKAILDEMSANNAKAVAALRQAQDNIAGRQYNPQLSGLAVAGALMSPTHSGSTSEGLGKGFDALREEMINKQKYEQDQQDLAAKYGVMIPDEEDKLLNAKLELQKLHEQQSGPLARTALTQLGRSLAKPGAGAAGASPFGKIAHDEGLEPGTPEFTARVHKLAEADLKDKAARAGVDSEDMSDDDRAALATQYGIPTTAPLPWQGLSTKQKTAAMNVERTKGLAELSKSDAVVQQDQSILNDLDRFMFLNKRANTSTLQGIPGIHFVTGLTDDHKEMDKISSRLGPLMRQPGMGRMTNLDLTTFMASTVGRDKPYQVNDSIRTAQKTAIDNALAYNEYAHNYFAVHKTLEGAREAWDQYLQANPSYDPSAPKGSFRANPNRQSYKDYFRSQSAGPSAGGSAQTGPSAYSDVTQQDRDDPTFAGMSDEAIHKSKIPAKARGGRIRGFAEGGKVQPDDDYKATLEDLARSLEQGASFQWGDEVNAGLTPGPYAQNVQSERGQQERFGTSHPWTNTGLEIAGGAGSGYAAGKLGQLALKRMEGRGGRAAALAALIAKYTPKSFTGKSALIGGAAGALSGAGSSPDVEGIPGAAGQQALIGSVVGPLAGLATKYGVSGTMALLDKLRGAGIPAGSQKVLNALASDKTTVDEIQARLARSRRLGVPSNVANVGDENVQALAQGVATKPGPKVGEFVQGLQDRQGGANERVGDLVNKALKPDDYTDKLKDLTTQLYQNAKPLYEQAYSQFPRVKSDVIGDILATKPGKTAGKKAFMLMQADGVPIGQADATGMIKKPSLQYLDYVKRGLDDQIGTAQNAGRMNEARIMRGMRDRLKNELDTITADPNGQPGPYQLARQQYAGDLEVLDALKLGRDEFGKLNPRDLTNATANMSYAEKDALRTGAAENLFQTIASTPNTTNPAAKLANIPAVGTKLKALFDNDSEYNKFMEAMTQEMQNFNQSRQIIATAARSRATGAAQDLDPTGHLGEAAYEGVVAGAHPLWAGARAARWIGNKVMPSDTADQAADILGIDSSGGAPAKAALDTLKAHAANLSNRVSMSQMAGLTAAGAASGAVAPDPWGNLDNGAQ